MQGQDQSQGEGDVSPSNNSSIDNYNSDGDENDESGQGGQSLSPSSVPTARSLLENMSIATRLTRLSLDDSTETHLDWIVLQIVRHCPFLNSLKPPLPSSNGISDLARVIQERPGRLEHLELSDLQFWDIECAGADFLHNISPEGSRTGKAQNGVNNLSPEGHGPQEGGGLRSLTMTIRGYDDFGSGDDHDHDHDSSFHFHFTTALIGHFSTLERISITGSGYF